MIRSFGTLGGGQRVDAIVLGRAHGLQVEVLTYGAILHRLTYPVAGVRRDLILRLDGLDDYLRDRAYVGPLVGRFGNRIADAKFSIDGREHRLTANEGVNHLHGGALGFGRRLWRIVDAGEHRATLGYRSPAGEEGYPGSLDVTLTLLAGEHSLSITIQAQTDAPTPVNLTYHPYFNLAPDPRTDATTQRLRIPASHYLPVRAGLIPTGEIAPVEGTPFDFRHARRVAPPDPRAHPQLAHAGGYDHCWVLDRDADCACELWSPDGDLRLKMLGSGPGLQFYNGQFLQRTHPAIGSGIILEPQGLPDAPNQPRFPDAILRPGQEYRAAIEYQLHA
ncbi:MAG TPA: aldose epimerase family protein [Steroidobacteraceae bacterium]|jgi:aldose 1-epimerase|nr:aldose epimerase family protein [Steroidobacteraceae bacterium]